MLGKIEGGRRRGQQSMRWLDGITNSVDKNLQRNKQKKNLCKLWEIVKESLVQSMGLQRVRQDLATDNNKSKKFANCQNSSSFQTV